MRQTLLLALLALPMTLAADGPAAATNPALAGLVFRPIGPGIISGRIVDIAVDPANSAHYFVAAASGGVWRTVNDGASWTPVFDNEGSYSIGALALDPKTPSTLWVGSGEANSQRSVAYGDGIYRSDDSGRTWKNLGLKNSEHIGRIAIDPRDSRVVYVAAQGPLWSPGGDRGLYKTSDGGKTWTKSLSISENTGVTDVAIDPRNPDVLLAAAYQRRRHQWTLIDGGPESAIYKSTDAGATWTKITAGIPGEDLGRITFAPSKKDPAVVYASIEAANKHSGIFRSADFGSSWELRNAHEFAGMYFGRIFADPHSVDRIYFMDVRMSVSDDGGKTLRPLGERFKHSDNHVIWIDPRDPDHYLVGCDGGVYETYDRAANWSFKNNLPLGQFYDVTVDHRAPFYSVFGGTQDNFSLGGPARTRSASGITNADWYVTQGGDGFQSRVDPEDSDTVYAELQYGVLARYDRRTGERLGIQPQPGAQEEAYRWNWDAPIVISPHHHTRLYFAANKLFRSDDRGGTWKTISPDLTQRIERNKLPVMGKIWGPDAVAKNTSTAAYSNLSTINESPKKEGLIYTGSDDGVIQVTEDGGGHWRKTNDFPGVPERSYVSRIVASLHDEKTVYAAFENHQSGDYAPYLLRSTDAGRTWRPIRGNLPEKGSVYAIAEDPVNKEMLFAGTEYGLFFTLDGGGLWTRLRGGLPTIAVRDIAVQKQMHDLVVGTFGRGLYILDDYSPLRELNGAALAKESLLLPVRDVPLYLQTSPYGGRGKSFQGEAFFTAENPPYGATFTYYLKSALKTRAERRRELEKKGAVEYPDLAELRAEAQEEAPAVILTVADAEGNVVRRLTGPAGAGVQRVTWDLREFAPVLPHPATGADEDDSPHGPSGPLVMPGKYQVSMALRLDGALTPVPGSQSFTAGIPGQKLISQADQSALSSFQQKVAKLQRAVTGSLELANSVKGNLAAMKRALYETPKAGGDLLHQAAGYEKRVEEILAALRGDTVLRAHEEPEPPSISERVSGIVESERLSSAAPTAAQMQDYEIASSAFQAELGKLKALIHDGIRPLEEQMERIGAPWTPGRMIEYSAK